MFFVSCFKHVFGKVMLTRAKHLFFSNFMLSKFLPKQTSNFPCFPKSVLVQREVRSLFGKSHDWFSRHGPSHSIAYHCPNILSLLPFRRSVIVNTSPRFILQPCYCLRLILLLLPLLPYCSFILPLFFSRGPPSILYITNLRLCSV